VASFWSAFAAALLFSILSFILSLVLVPKTTTSLKFNILKNNEEPRKTYDDVIDVEGKVMDQDQDKADIRDIGT
jgi:lipopolysaccharide export LptBFGC system permease protein LptF